MIFIRIYNYASATTDFERIELITIENFFALFFTLARGEILFTKFINYSLNNSQIKYGAPINATTIPAGRVVTVIIL